jgi:hypothetical protein
MNLNCVFFFPPEGPEGYKFESNYILIQTYLSHAQED